MRDIRDIMYFISSHSRADSKGVMRFEFPLLPDPAMGERFRAKIVREHKEIEDWIKANPYKFKKAENGYFI